jgi:hypothetical protein
MPFSLWIFMSIKILDFDKLFVNQLPAQLIEDQGQVYIDIATD